MMLGFAVWEVGHAQWGSIGRFLLGAFDRRGKGLSLQSNSGEHRRLVCRQHSAWPDSDEDASLWSRPQVHGRHPERHLDPALLLAMTKARA
jgi:hypothetical protein